MSNEMVVQPTDAQEDRDAMQIEALLVERLRAGSAQARDEALDALFRQHYAQVYAVLYRLVGDEADDLAQEVFLRLYRQPPRNTGADLAAWLYRVATNLGYNALRGRRRLERYRDMLGAMTGALGWQRQPEDPVQAAGRREEAGRVRVILAELRERDAAILVLRHQGLSYREVAATLGVAPGSVGTMLARAERAFRELYVSRYGGAPEEGR
jgi:RNA polymerase sigma-70 factor, ECF subfamily